MTIEEVQKLVQQIQEYADQKDHEAAHLREDALWASVLLAIHHGGIPGLAGEALKTRRIKFMRYYA